ncbi:hypothetical protein [Neisseria gonorrhoeae]|uniref:hypothetical protein n=1 Tax=Neisseria gonorrhoeae TaxID=485 RepID=UPI0001CF4B8B|nr:hypothetical protein [Neisseria gonorrhoeae]EFF39347.1 predicted protein [Neisseria gonorrhoeae F62]OIA19225.1 hypothetical protein BBZ84_06840 [Neisseria gonorrhoeae]QBK52147.1 hypothetical protein TFGA2_01126 [Neisseria gonorrhoeae]QBK53766.1 hypothetical protein TFGB2_00529 [Neisseria gonorrhoeae]CNQ70096.1 integral membrane protein [Neisseria gonorrhoeae]
MKQSVHNKTILSVLISSMSVTAFSAPHPPAINAISVNRTDSGELIGFEFNNADNTVTGNADITVKPADPSQHSRPKGLIIRSDRNEPNKNQEVRLNNIAD